MGGNPIGRDGAFAGEQGQGQYLPRTGPGKNPHRLVVLRGLIGMFLDVLATFGRIVTVIIGTILPILSQRGHRAISPT